ncbi:MAG: hypothetical protein J7K26_04305 [Candidatus Aenigmarchaeota archaeon]|nr:hypothetical protein [Candidatus Aenigmarchaeota archaeon]
MLAKNGIVHLYELPENEVCIKLPKRIQKEMFLLASKIAGDNIKLSKILKINNATLHDFKKSRFASTRLKIVEKLSNFLVKNGYKQYTLENLEKKVLAIKTHWVGKFIYNPKFPINFNTEAGVISIGAFLFDGGITQNKYPFYTNSEKYLIDKVIRSVEKTVGKINYNIRKQKTGTIVLDLPKILGLILIHGLNIPAGKKIFTNPEIPEFIMNGSKEIKRAFLQQAFDDEGTPQPGKNTSGRGIQLTQSGVSRKPSIRLFQLKELISSFNIPVNGPHYMQEYVSKSGTITHLWAIQITNQRDIRKFAERINFSLTRKIKKLQEVLDSYVLPEKYKKGENLKVALKACEKLKSQNRKITIRDISKLINRTELHTKDIMDVLVKQNSLMIIKPKRSSKQYRGGFLPKEFEALR